MSQAHYLRNGYHEFKPRGAVSFNEKAIAQAIETSGLVLGALKVDGVRVILQVHTDGRVTCTSRQSKVLPALARIGDSQRDALRGTFPDGAVLDCEVTVKGRSFQEGCGDLRRKTPIAPDQLIVWPILRLPYAEVADGRAVDYPLEYRRVDALNLANALAAIIGFTVKDPRIGAFTSVADIETAFAKAQAEGFEGLLVYDPQDMRFSGGKLTGWWKVKPEADIDGTVINWVEGTGKYVGMMGALTVQCEDGTLTDVGTGFTDDQRRLPREYWIGRIVQLTFMERTDDGNLRHPAFDRLRDTDTDPGVKS